MRLHAGSLSACCALSSAAADVRHCTSLPAVAAAALDARFESLRYGAAAKASPSPARPGSALGASAAKRRHAAAAPAAAGEAMPAFAEFLFTPRGAKR